MLIRVGWILISGLTAAAGEPIAFQPEDHCVAWKARKTILLLGSDEPIGKSCTLNTEVQKRGKMKVFVGEFPLQAFKSGADGRDEAVVELLGGPTRTQLGFESEPMPPEVYDRTLKQGGSVRGTLRFLGQDHPVVFQLTVPQQGVLRGFAQVTFSDLGLEAPTVLGGLGAKVQNDLDLGFQFQVDRISDPSASKVKPKD